MISTCRVALYKGLVRMASSSTTVPVATIQRMQQKSEQAQQLSKLLKSQISGLQQAKFSEACRLGEERLTLENEALRIEVEKLKLHLAQLEIKNGVKQVGMPGSSSSTVSQASVVDKETLATENVKKATQPVVEKLPSDSSAQPKQQQQRMCYKPQQPQQQQEQPICNKPQQPQQQEQRMCNKPQQPPQQQQQQQGGGKKDKKQGKNQQPQENQGAKKGEEGANKQPEKKAEGANKGAEGVKKQAEGVKGEMGGSEGVDASRLNMRIGFIRSAKRHPDADALYVEEVDVGEERPRTIVSGLVKHIPLEQMQERYAVFLLNLKPAKMRGVLSEGMIMCASTPEKVEIIEPPAGVTPGQRVIVENFPGPSDDQLNPKKKIWEQIQPDLKISGEGLASYRGSLWRLEGQPDTLFKAPSLKDCPIK